MRAAARAALAGLVLPIGLSSCRAEAPDPLVLSVPYEVDTLDPHARDRVGNFGISSHFYEPLVSTDSEMSIVPGLAVDWHNPDDRTWVFQLRPGARFHDGARLEAEDVVFSFERLRQNPQLEIGVYATGIESVRAAGPQTVEMRTARPAAALLNKLLSVAIVKRGSTASALASGENGSGRYRLVEWRRGDQIDVVAGEGGPGTALRRVTFRLGRSRSESLSDFLSGRSDLAQIGSRAEEEALRGRDVTVLRRTGIFVKYLGFDMAREETPFVRAGRNPFLSPDVREAISLAIDRNRLGEFGVPSSQVLPPFLLGHEPSLAVPRPDLARARALLAQAGLPRGFAVTLHVRKVVAEAAPLLREMLAAIGIDVTLAILTDEEFYALAAQPGFSFFLTRYGCSTGDPGDVLEAALHSPDPGRRLGGQNLGRYANPELDHAIEESGTILGSQQRGEQLRGIMRRLAGEKPCLPLYFSEDVYAVRRGLAWKPRADSYVFAWEIEPRR